MSIGKRITVLRNEKGLQQNELAKQLGIDRSRLGHYENDRRKPDYKTLCKLAEIFGTTTDYILGHSDLRQGRLLTRAEMATFLPPPAIKKIDEEGLQFLVDRLDNSTMEEVKRVLREHGYLE